MSENSTPNERPCKTCGKPVIDNGLGNVVHVGGGVVEQVCKNGSCGWKGGQSGGFDKCPRCGDGTQLVTDHRAS